MNEFASALIRLWEESTLVGRLEIVSNMQERGAFEGGPECTDLGIGGNETREPIVRDAHRRYYASLAAELEAGFAKYS
jgi:hypothetical protein